MKIIYADTVIVLECKVKHDFKYDHVIILNIYGFKASVIHILIKLVLWTFIIKQVRIVTSPSNTVTNSSIIFIQECLHICVNFLIQMHYNNDIHFKSLSR